MTIQKIICEIKDNVDIDWTKDFIEEGIFDSLDIMELVDQLEKKFGCSIDRADILPENFVSLCSIEDMVVRNGGKI